MQKIKTSDKVTWKGFEDGNFVVNKNEIPFTDIGNDHAIEQEIKILKTSSGGLTSLTQKEDTLDRHFLCAPKLKEIMESFDKMFMINIGKSFDQHHEAYGSTSSTITKNAKNLEKIFIERNIFGIGTDEHSKLYNIYSKKEVSKDIKDEILNRDTLGQQRLNKGEELKNR